MHEVTQRRLLRCAFLLMCVLPTTLVGGWAIFVWHPTRSVTWQRELSALTGLAVEVTDVVPLQPSVVRLSGLQLLDPDTRELVAQIDSLDIDSQPDELRLSGRHLTIAVDRYPVIWQVIHNRLFRQDALQGRTLVWSVDRLSLDGSSVFHAGDANGTFQTADHQQVANAQLRLRHGSDQPLVVSIERDRGISPVKAIVSWRTGVEPWPLKTLPFLVASTMDRTAVESATFCGEGSATIGTDDWVAELSGRLDQMDLAQLVPSAGRHRLAAVGSLQLERVKWNQTSLLEAYGSLRTQAGQVQRSLLDALIDQELGLPGPGLSLATEELEQIPITELAIDFQLNEKGVTIRGVCQGDTPHVSLLGENGPVLLGPRVRDIPIDWLAHAMVDNRHNASQEAMRAMQLSMPRPLPRPLVRR